MAKEKTVKQQKRAQKARKNEGLTAYLNFLLSGQVENDKQIQLINETAKRTAKLSEAAAIAKIMAAQMDQKLTQVMDVVQIQHKVLQKLGATEDMFNEAEKEYNEQLAAVQKELEERSKKKQAAPAEAEASSEDKEKEVSEGELEEFKKTVEEHNA